MCIESRGLTRAADLTYYEGVVAAAHSSMDKNKFFTTRV